MSEKHLINKVDDAVDEALLGFTFNYPALELLAKQRTVLAPNWHNENDVGVISGGGSGHEPFSAGFVGAGMLTAAVAGGVFASPPSSNILHAIKTVTTHKKAGCLVIIPNYTGDCLNFGLAIERAKLLGLNIEQVVVGDDCSIPESKLSIAGKRALPGIVLVIKVAGALASKGKNLEKVTKFAKLTADNIASCSVGLRACTMLGQKELMFEIPSNEVVYGQGIHGEDGNERRKLTNATKTAAYMISRIREVLPFDDSKNQGVVILVNNFGGLTQLELQIFVKEVCTQLVDCKVRRVYSGHLMTSLNAVGLHLTILRLPAGEDGTEILDALDAPTQAPSWPGCTLSQMQSTQRPKDLPATQTSLKGPELGDNLSILLRLCLLAACDALIGNERIVNELDRGCGDADCGTTHKNLADGIKSELKNLTLSRPATLLFELATIAENRMGGTSGAIYSLLLTAAATELAKRESTENWLQVWLDAWRAGIDGIKKYSKARVGDKTLMDVIEPLLDKIEKRQVKNYKEAAKIVSECAEEYALKTKELEPRAGRASYVHDPEYRRKVDAGAYAASQWIQAIAMMLQ